MFAQRIVAADARGRSDRLMVGLIAALVIGLLCLSLPVVSDVGCQLWLADRLRHGARLYVDIAELNPPLWFWLAIPVDAAAAWAGAAPERALTVAIGLTVWLALAAVGALLPADDPRRRLILCYGAFVLIVMPVQDMGQREQLALIAAWPWIALAAARADRRPVTLGLALTIGLATALGFMLKHYFLIVPALLEGWLAIRLRRSWQPVRAETVGLAVAGVSYAAAIGWLTPTYLTETLPEARLAYGLMAAAGWGMIGSAQPVWLVLVMAIAVKWRSDRRQALPSAALIAAAGFAAGWFIQHKGWSYHGIAVTGSLALALAAVIGGAPAPTSIRGRAFRFALLALPLLLAAVTTRTTPGAELDIAPGLSGAPPGANIAIVSTAGWTVWPAMPRRGFRIASRYNQYWQLYAIDAHPDDPRIAAYGRRVIRRTLADYRCQPPGWLIFVRPVRGSSRASEDPLAYFRRDRAFSAFLSGYRLTDRHGFVDTFRPVRPTAIPADCDRR